MNEYSCRKFLLFYFWCIAFIVCSSYAYIEKIGHGLILPISSAYSMTCIVWDRTRTIKLDVCDGMRSARANKAYIHIIFKLYLCQWSVRKSNHITENIQGRISEPFKELCKLLLRTKKKFNRSIEQIWKMYRYYLFNLLKLIDCKTYRL